MYGLFENTPPETHEAVRSIVLCTGRCFYPSSHRRPSSRHFGLPTYTSGWYHGVWVNWVTNKPPTSSILDNQRLPCLANGEYMKGLGEEIPGATLHELID